MTSMQAMDAHKPKLNWPGRYSFEAVIAEGGMGTIHRAYDRLAACHVAYKRIRVGTEAQRPRMTALFQREFDTLAQLNHPCVVKAYDFGFDEVGPYYTMELLSGADLTRSGPLARKEAARVLRDIASALALLHARRLVHRDVCPNNVRLTESGVAKLIDFGALTSFGSCDLVVGTPPFMAPENVHGDPLDQRTDLFSLGALAYWLLTRQAPYPGRSLDEVQFAWKQPVRPPSALASDVPPALDELILALLSVEPGARPQSASHVIERLTAIADLPPEHDVPEVVASYLHHPPLQGRARELAELGAQLDELAAGRGGVLKIEGAPGLGRSELLAHLATGAQLRGLTVLRARGGLQPGTLGAAKELARLALGMFPDLSRQLPEQVATFSAPTEEPVGAAAIDTIERHARCAAAIRDILLALSERNRVVIIVDDLHLCDPSSVALLGSLSNSLARILLALSSLPEDAPCEPGRRQLETLARRLPLEPLSASEIDALVKATLGQLPSSDAFAEVLYRRAGGSPGYTMDVLRAALASGLLTYAGGTFALPRALLELPEVGGTLQRFRLDKSDPTAMAIAELLSVSGRALTTHELGAACRLSAPAVLETLQRLERQRVVLREADRVALSASELATELARALPGERRHLLHMKLAGLCNTGTLEAEVEAGLHLMRAGDPQALPGARRVAAAIADRIHEVSAKMEFVPALEAALAVLGRHGQPDSQCLQLLIPLAISGFYCDYALQRRYLQRALEALAARTGIALAMRLRRWCGVRIALWIGLFVGGCTSVLRGRRGDARTLRRDLEGYLGALASGVAAAANANDMGETERLSRWLAPLAGAASRAVRVVHGFCEASIDAARGQNLRAIERFQQVLEWLSKPVTGMDDRFRAHLRLGAVYGLAHLFVERAPEKSLELAGQLERESAFFAPHAAGVRMGCALYFGDTARAAALQARAEVLALRPGLIWSAYTGLILRFIHGMAMIDDVVAVARNVDENRQMATISPEAGMYLEIARAHLSTLRGRPHEAVRELGALVERIGTRNLALRLLHAAALARALRESGQPRLALQVCERSDGQIPNQEREQPMLTDLLLQQRALSHASLGDTETAAKLLDQRIHAREASGTPLLRGTLHRERAQVALLTQDRPAFQHHSAQMLEHFRRTGNPHLLQQHDLLMARAQLPAHEQTIVCFSEEPLESGTVSQAMPKRLARATRT
jgi:Protein kinase domain/AAA ATPase domain